MGGRPGNHGAVVANVGPWWQTRGRRGGPLWEAVVVRGRLDHIPSRLHLV